MVEIAVRVAGAGDVDAVEAALSGGGDGRSCRCQWWTLTATEFSRSTRPEREGMLREQLNREPGPGLIAEVDGAAAGWARVGPRTEQPRLARTRAFARSSAEPWGDPAVWALTCFSVRREHRGRGVSTRLLRAAIDRARAGGARVLEAYPVDTAVADASPNELYHGVLSSFLAAGFREVARTHPHRAIVALALR